jgi:tRNA(fMet)-specific endonuclease VapC
MSGDRFVLDTNAVVSLLNGTSGVTTRVSDASWLGISVITRLEFLAFSKLSRGDEELFERFCARVDTIGLTKDDVELIEIAVRLRREYGLKLPDAVIAATAIIQHADLVTADEDFNKVDGLSVVRPIP